MSLKIDFYCLRTNKYPFICLKTSKTLSLGEFDESKINDLKIRPDRPVGPSTGAKTGLVHKKTRFAFEPSVNPPNRRSDL